MATSAQTVEKVADLLQNLKIDSQSGIGGSGEVPANGGTSSHGPAMEASVPGVVDATKMPVAYEAGMDAGMYYAVNGFAMPHAYYYGGFECPMGDWEDYMRHASVEGVEVANSGVYSENGPLLYHPASYGYGPQHLYGPYAPGTPIPAISADGQFYGAQGYPYAGHIYQQSVPPNAPYIPSSAPTGIDLPIISAGESSFDASVGTAGSENNAPSSARSAYSYARGILPISVPTSGSQDVRVGHEGTRAGTTWADSSKVAESQQRHGLSQPVSDSGQTILPVAPLLPHIPSGQQHQPPPGVAATPGTLGRVFQPSLRMYAGPGRAGQILGMNSLESRGNSRNWIAADKGKLWGRGNGMINNGISSLDVLNEQNRGPRTTRTRNQRMAPGAVRYVLGQGVANGTPEPVSLQATIDHYNLPEFSTNYNDAKFFIIKSYSEDDIHKSIKYSVWASTANGNKKLDAAYQEAQAGSGHGPLFLFFSVNASGQFCGLAEMVGPVDFNKSVDFWQQDKWTGKFPVKWHIIKDVPNNHFRHIILENNDNKPVTNSRDTQEVRLDQGLEMLNIFKNFVLKTSILDDFQFYENRQKAMQEKRARQQQHQQVVSLGGKYLEQNHPQEDASRKLQEGGTPAEALEKGGKSVELKGGHVNLVPSESCNGNAAEEVHLDKSLSKSDSRDSSQARVVEIMLSSRDAVSGSLKSSSELLGKK